MQRMKQNKNLKKKIVVFSIFEAFLEKFPIRIMLEIDKISENRIIFIYLNLNYLRKFHFN